MKKILKYLPLPLDLFGVVFCLIFREKYEALAYIVCAVCVAISIVLICVTNSRTQIKNANTEEQLLKWIADGETFFVIFNVLSPKNWEKPNRISKFFPSTSIRTGRTKNC